MKTLHCFTDDCDTVIAESVEDALRAHPATADLDPEMWEPVPDDAPITIHCDEKGEPAMPGDPGVAPVTKTAAEWAKRGRGFLCTTEY